MDPGRTEPSEQELPRDLQEAARRKNRAPLRNGQPEPMDPSIGEDAPGTEEVPERDPRQPKARAPRRALGVNRLRQRPQSAEAMPAPATLDPETDLGELEELEEVENGAARRPPRARPRQRRRWVSGPLIVLVAVILVVGPAVAAYLISRSQQAEYAAEAELVLDSSNVTDRILAQRDIDTQSLVLQSRAVLAPTARAEGITVDELEDKVGVEVDGNTDVLRVSVTDHDSQLALRAAEGIVTTYRDSVATATTEQLDEAQGLLEAEITDLTTRLSDVQAELSQLAEDPDNAFSPEVQQLQAESNFIFGRLSSLQASLTDLEVRRVSGSNEVKVVTPPHVLEEPVSPQPLRAAAYGGLVGILLAAAAIVLLLRLRSRHVEPS
jgi:uncharacterized protein involved in exopolysaccharide biosynthesis